MRKIIRCSNNSCNQTIQVTYQDTDQLIMCPKCNTKFLFVNLGVYSCKTCKNVIKLPLFAIYDNFTCEHCNQKYTVPNPNSFAFTPFISPELDFCGCCMRDSWQDMEQEAYTAKLAFKKIENKFSPYRKRAIFIELLEYPNSIFPIRYIRFLHTYCNFKLYEQYENPKYFGSLLGFDKQNIIGELVRKKELLDIWVLNEKTKEVLNSMPSFTQYKNRIKII